MKNFKNIIVLIIAVCLAFVAIIGIFSQPADGCQHWFLTFILSKFIGFSALILLVMLAIKNKQVFKDFSELIEKF